MLLCPITTWRDMVVEAETTGVEFDAFWYACVNEEVAYFFRWLGVVRATVLVVFDESGPMFIESRRAHDAEFSGSEGARVVREVLRLFPVMAPSRVRSPLQ